MNNARRACDFKQQTTEFNFVTGNYQPRSFVNTALFSKESGHIQRHLHRVSVFYPVSEGDYNRGFPPKYQFRGLAFHAITGIRGLADVLFIPQRTA